MSSLLNARATAGAKKLNTKVAAMGAADFANFSKALLNCGSRTPTGAPAWVTLEVLHGGFASGKYKAQLKEGEEPSTAKFFTDQTKVAELESMLDTGKYRLEAPENGAFLSVLYLQREGRTSDATALLEEILPWGNQLRFYPYPDKTGSVQLSGAVALENIADVRFAIDHYRNCNDPKTVPRVRVMKAQQVHAEEYTVLESGAIELILQTIDDKANPPIRVDGKVEGAWPFQDEEVMASDAFVSACKTRIGAYKSLKTRMPLTRRTNDGRPMCEMFRALETIANGHFRKGTKKSLTGKQVGLVRAIIADINASRGLPGSKAAREFLDHVHRAAPAVTISEHCDVLMRRLKRFGATEVIDDVNSLLVDVEESETDHNTPSIVNRPMPEFAERILNRALRAPVDTLIEIGVVKSAEQLSYLIRQLSAQGIGARIEDPVKRNLVIALYMAFSKRRSLLLKNLEKQVKVDELPWIAPLLLEAKQTSGSAADRQSLCSITMLWWKYFPETQLPNKLAQAYRDVVKSANVKCPVTEELAVDIFEGSFSDKYNEAARIAACEMRGSLYARYFRLDDTYDAILNASDGGKKSGDLMTWGTQQAAVYGVSYTYSYNPANNGRLLECTQLITTHNLIQLLLATSPVPPGFDFGAIANSAWHKAIMMLRQQPDDWHSRLRLKKDVAYAIRQMIFFLSMADPDQQSFWVATMRRGLEEMTDCGESFKQDMICNVISPLEHLMESTDTPMTMQPVLAWFDGWKIPAWK